MPEGVHAMQQGEGLWRAYIKRVFAKEGEERRGPVAVPARGV